MSEAAGFKSVWLVPRSKTRENSIFLDCVIVVVRGVMRWVQVIVLWLRCMLLLCMVTMMDAVLAVQNTGAGAVLWTAVYRIL